MLENFNIYRTHKFSKLKERTRKGIPDGMRGIAWINIAGVSEYKKGKENLYKNLLSNIKSNDFIDKKEEDVIIRDLHRTFPKSIIFNAKLGEGQRNLFRILMCMGAGNKSTGYVQGMGYLVGLFLIYMNEESSFYLLHSLIKNYELEGIYKQGFPDLKKKFYVLLNLEKKFIPKIYDVLKRDGIFPSIYASEWFICLFSKDLKINVLVRIFDTFLFEGFKVIYRFALAFLKMKEKQFTKGKPGIVYTMEIIKKCFEDIDIEALFKVAFSFHLSKKHINRFELEYEQNKNNDNNEFMKQL